MTNHKKSWEHIKEKEVKQDCIMKIYLFPSIIWYTISNLLNILSLGHETLSSIHVLCNTEFDCVVKNRIWNLKRDLFI